MKNSMKNKKEFITLPFEIKQVPSEGSDVEGIVTIKGLAAAFGSIDLKGDVIEKGAFEKWLKVSDIAVPILLNHNPSMETTAGYNIEAEETNQGLLVTGELNTKTAAGATAFENIKHAEKLGKKIGLSIGYIAKEKRYEGDLRFLEEIDVVEYSLTNFPANKNAKVVSIKEMLEKDDAEEIAEQKRFIEKSLREAGVSKKSALDAVHLIFNDEVKDETNLSESDKELDKGDTNEPVVNDKKEDETVKDPQEDDEEKELKAYLEAKSLTTVFENTIEKLKGI